jgi:hypothetical protein
MPSVSVCIAHIYPERRSNLGVIFDALRGGTLPPDEIIVWNNDTIFPVPSAFGQPNVQMIHAMPNPGPCARFLAALTARSQFIFFQGSDVAVQPDTVRHLHDLLVTRPNVTLGLEGRILHEGQPYNYHIGKGGLDGKLLQQPTHNDISMGRMDIISRDVMVQCLPDVPLFEREDDIWFSYALAKHHIERLVVPYTPGVNGFTNLQEGGVGNCTHPKHMNWRDDLCKQLFPTERGK